MIASPYSIPTSKKTLEVTGTPYYVPTAAATNKTLSATRNNGSSTRAMSITREEPQSSAPQTSSNLESSNTSSNGSSSNSSTLIYVPVSSTATAASAQPFGVPLVTAKPVTPTFSVGMKNDKHK